MSIDMSYQLWLYLEMQRKHTFPAVEILFRVQNKNLRPILVWPATVIAHIVALIVDFHWAEALVWDPDY